MNYEIVNGLIHAMSRDDVLRLYERKDTRLADLQEADPGARELLEGLEFTARRQQIVALLADVPDEVKQVAMRLDLRRVRRNEIAARLSEAFAAAGLPERVVADAAALLRPLDEPGSPELLDDDQARIRDLHALAPALDRARLYVIADAAGIAADDAETLVRDIRTPAQVDDATLKTLVARERITDETARTLGRVADIFRVADENAVLVNTVKRSTLPQLAVLPPKRWEQVIAGCGAPPPPGLDTARWAAKIAGRLAHLHPTVAVWGRLPRIAPEALQEGLAVIDPLLRIDRKGLSRSAASLRLDAVPPDRREVVSQAQRELSRFANAYPGLGLHVVLQDTARSPQERAQEATRRLQILGRAMSPRTGVEWLALDYAPGGNGLRQLAALGDLAPADMRMLAGFFKAQQRLHRLTGNVDVSASLGAAGFHSAVAVGSTPIERLVVEAGLSYDDACRIQGHAQKRLSGVAAAAGGAIDMSSSLSMALMKPFQDPRSYLKKLTGYDDLFGSQAFCDCAHCRSILGPAAYFVDLMAFVQRKVRSKHFPPDRPDHPLDLKTRRPDLWHIPLTCANTDTLVPTLTLVNEILENAVYRYVWDAKPPLDDDGGRTKIETAVYRALYAGPAGIPNVPPLPQSLNQPFCLPLARVDTLLPHFERSRADVARALGASTGRHDLRMSPRQLALVRGRWPAPRQVELGRLFGVAPQADGSVPACDVQPILRKSGLTRAEFQAAIETHFVCPNEEVKVRAEKQHPESVQNDIERVHGLTFAILDRLHRFLRLWRHSGWTIPEVDFALRALDAVAHDRDDGERAAVVSDFAFLVALRARLNIGVEELCALFWVNESNATLSPRAPALLPRLFKGRADLGPTEEGLPAQRGFLPSQAPNPDLPRVLAGLGVDEDELALLLAGLDHWLEKAPLAPGGDPAAPSVALLNLANLTLLYRHARLARRLGLSVAELLRLCGLLSRSAVTSLAQLRALLPLVDRWRRSKRTLAELDAVTDPPGAAGVEVSATLEALQKEAAGAFDFSGAVFAAALDAPEAASQNLVLRNVGDAEATEALPESWQKLPALPVAERYVERAASSASTTHFRLGPNCPPKVDIDLLTGPAVAATREALLGTKFAAELHESVRAVLHSYHVSRVLPVQLAALLKRDPALVAEWLDMARLPKVPDEKNQPSIEVGWAELLPAVRQDPGADDTPLRLVLRRVQVLSRLFADPCFDHVSMAFVKAHRGLFDLQDLDAVPASALWKVATYGRTLAALGNAAKAAETEPDLASLHDALTTHYSADLGFDEAADRILATALGTGPAVVAGIRTVLSKLSRDPKTALDMIDRLADGVALALHLGVDGQSLVAMLSEDYDAMAQAADGLVAAFQRKYPDDKQREKNLRPYLDQLLGVRRDALVDTMLRTVGGPFETARDLYHHYLIDVEVEGVVNTSRLVSAISAVQLYVHRCRLDLEQTAAPAGEANHVHVAPKDIPWNEWEWRRNYRVWEANRKVFLWPENYLEPDVRDDKTPLFEELESTLLQQDINEQTVAEAYTTYVRGLEEVASLRIAGAWHDRSTNQENDNEANDTLHLFGCTSDDPPVWYYRTADNASDIDGPIGKRSWNPWRKIAVQIPVRTVSPVVFQGRLHVFWVEIRTRSVNRVVNGESLWDGYDHTLKVKFVTEKPDGSWTATQDIDLTGSTGWLAGERPGVVRDRLKSFWVTLTDSNEKKVSKRFLYDQSLLGSDVAAFPSELIRIPIDALGNAGGASLSIYEGCSPPEPDADYALKGPSWESVSVDVFETGGEEHIFLRCRNAAVTLRLDLFARTALSAVLPIDYQQYLRLLTTLPTGDLYGFDKWVYDETVNAAVAFRLHARSLSSWAIEHKENKDDIKSWASPKFVSYDWWLATLPARTELVTVAGGPSSSCIAQVGRDIIRIWWGIPLLPKGESGLLLDRLGTTLGPQVARRMFETGVAGLLEIEFQEKLAEPCSPVTAGSAQFRDWLRPMKALDLRGPYGTYYQELFFHIPFLIANHLNSQQRFTEAQAWYHYLFDPTADETHERDPRFPYDRVWRYIGFRRLDIPKLREILTDGEAIEKYREDPFNPYGIARCRWSAFQKAVVMKYIDNLIDWGDQLFAQFTTESLNEATLLYTLAADILGERPPALGKCAEPKKALTFATLEPALELDAGGEDPRHEFLIELESLADYGGPLVAELPKTEYSVGDRARLNIPDDAVARYTLRSPRSIARGRSAADAGVDWDFVIGLILQVGAGADPDGGPAAKTQPAFCIPVNKDLLEYWNRVEKRLFQLRNGLDIDGVRRQPSLFAPELDPRLIIRAKQAGLSIQDVLDATGGSLPPYRFLFLIERAKAYAATVQSFGSALLGAIEKRDESELNQLRLVHQKNIEKLNTWLRQWEIETAEEGLEALRRQREATEFRRDHYRNLVEEGLSGLEEAQAITKYVGTGFHVVGAGIMTLAAIGTLVPDIGSPFAMKWGGIQLGASIERAANAMRDIASTLDSVSSSLGLAAGFERREEEWELQRDTAERELKNLDRQIAAAEIRVEMATKSLEIHEETRKQLDELFTFHEQRFTSHGRYTWLATQLQRSYRAAWQNALAVAKLAEAAYRYERDDGTALLDFAGMWSAANAGLGAGEHLIVALQELERRFIETNYRAHEIEQSFALSQVAPDALFDLRSKGECTFEIGEFFFDLSYPGHYRRRIKGVRLTVPCVAGPYTNVGAVLTLTDSELRSKPDLGQNLEPYPPKRTVSVATSRAQGDAGVFEFSFHDERYMPFEGAGAVSSWDLKLPSQFKMFDYSTIADVVLTIHYTALYDEALRSNVENQLGSVERSIRYQLENTGFPLHVSLRQCYPDVFRTLVKEKKATLKLDGRELPFFLRAIGVADCAMEFKETKPLGDANLTKVGMLKEMPQPIAQPGAGELKATDALCFDTAYVLKTEGAFDAEAVKDVILSVAVKLSPPKAAGAAAGGGQ